MHSVFEFPKNAHWTDVSLPVYGRQDVGISPGGALDLFAHQTGQAMLGNALASPSVEFVFPLRCRVKVSGWMVVTGARRQMRCRNTAGGDKPVPHGEVVRIRAGDHLIFGPLEYGLRSYLSWRADEGGGGVDPAGRVRGDFLDTFSWPDPDRRFRVMRGPEFDQVANLDLMFTDGWRVSRELSARGIRLEHGRDVLVRHGPDMISDVVADGTIQLTPSGPVVLLRHRQTIGGYPRILNVISADVDLLAQLVPGQPFRAVQVDVEEALSIARTKAAELDALVQRYKDPA